MSSGEERRKRAVEARIARVRRHVNLEVVVRAAVWPTWIAATAFVGWRILVQLAVPAAGGVLLVGALLATWLLARARVVSKTQAAVIADRRAEAGGLLLTRLELPVGDWELGLNQQLKELSLPPIRVRQPLALLGLAVGFVVVGLVMPQPRAGSRPRNAAAETRVEELAEKVTALAKEEPVDEAALAELERLKEELADGTFDAADWEAADVLEKQLDRQAAEAARELERAEQAAKRLEDALGNAQAGDAAAREREELEQALMALADGEATDAQDAMNRALGQQGREGQQGQRNAQGQDGEQGQGGQQAQQGQQGEQGQQGDQQPPPGQQGQARASAPRTDELRRALQQRQQQLAQRFNPGASNPRSASRPSAQQAQSGQAREGQEGRPGQDGQPGGHASRAVDPSAGVSRGGETSELVFGEHAEMDPSRLGFEPLPPGHGGEAEQLLGLRAANPKVNANVRPGTASGAAAKGDQAAGYDEGAMRPRNRALVQRYFDSTR